MGVVVFDPTSYVLIQEHCLIANQKDGWLWWDCQLVAKPWTLKSL